MSLRIWSNIFESRWYRIGIRNHETLISRSCFAGQCNVKNISYTSIAGSWIWYRPKPHHLSSHSRLTHSPPDLPLGIDWCTVRTPLRVPCTAQMLIKMTTFSGESPGNVVILMNIYTTCFTGSWQLLVQWMTNILSKWQPFRVSVGPHKETVKQSIYLPSSLLWWTFTPIKWGIIRSYQAGVR